GAWKQDAQARFGGAPGAFQVRRRVRIRGRSRAAADGDRRAPLPVEEGVELRLRQISRVRHGGADIAQAPRLDRVRSVMNRAPTSQGDVPWQQSARFARWWR